MKNFTYFNSLHQQENPLLIGNVWNAQSARIMEKLKFQAIATSSSAVAETLGFADGEVMSFEDYLFVIRRIKASSNLPLSVDLESGYGKTSDEVVWNIRKLHEVGVAGINLEDSLVEGGERAIVDAEPFSEKLKQIVASLTSKGIEIFLNVRCDTFLLGVPNARREALRRISIYEKSGVHGLFFPCITQPDDIHAVVQATKLPINVMCMPDLPDFENLKSAGVKRISMGNFVNHCAYKRMEDVLQQVLAKQNFSVVFN